MAESVTEWAQPNPINQNRQGIIGKGVERYEGPLKVSGTAPYAYEVETPSPPAFGIIVGAQIAAGEVSAVDDAAALAAPGVKLVWHAFRTPKQGERGARVNQGQAGADPVFDTPKVKFWGQPVAFVVADTAENARAAADLIRITYDGGAGDTHFTAEKGVLPRGVEESRTGAFEVAYERAPIKIDREYATPVQNHCQMEPCASTAWWEGGVCIVHMSIQSLKRPQHMLAETLQVGKDNVRVLSRYIGGGFGGKGPAYEDCVLAALASRDLGMPVKTAFTRQDMMHASVHRPATIQRVRLGATPDGRLDAMAIESVSHCARQDGFVENAPGFASALYAAPNRLRAARRVNLDLPVAGAMRAPGEAVGMLSLESAMDELAEALDLDPIELRLRNEPLSHPETGVPFSARQLVECMTDGAQRFGWSERQPKPRMRREGRHWIGMGMAASIRGNFLLPARASMKVEADGTVTVLQGMTDIGTGTYTILAQITAETMGVPLSQVRVEIGDSGFAPAPGSGGQFGAASAGSGAYETGMVMRKTLAEMAVGDPGSPLYGAPVAAVDFRDGLITFENRSETLASLVARLRPQGVNVDGQSIPAPDARAYAQHSYGAHFCEVSVDAVTGEVRVRRMLGAFACGRILNEKTARSQITGGMIWGIGTALTEINRVDERYGSFIGQDLGSYFVPSHADIVGIDAYFLPEVDDKANPLGIKGVGEVGICGAGAAVANAIYNACGLRLYDYPFTPDKLLEAGL